MNKIHVVFDEFSSLGKLEPVNQVIDLGRSFGIRCQFYVQDLSQLRRNFPEDRGETCLGNTTQIFFGTNSFQVAEYQGKRCGQHTVLVESEGNNSGSSRTWQEGAHPSQSGGRSWGRTNNVAQQGRSLLFPDEILALPPRLAMTFVAGMRPVVTATLRWYEEPWLTVKRPKRTARRLFWVLLWIAVAVAVTRQALIWRTSSERGEFRRAVPGAGQLPADSRNRR